MKIQLSEHFTYNKLLRFVFPSIVMMIFTSIYGVVDGLFVSNYAGKTAFAAINLIMPFIMALSALGFMVGTGGSAIVAKTLGEGKEKEANRYFSMLIYLTIFGGIVLSVLGILLARPVSIALGASGDLLDYCTLYGRITFLSLTPFMLQNVFQCFFVTAEKPKLGLLVIVLAGVTNMVLDYLFIAVFGMGLVGAAIATVCGECIGGFVPLIYFAAKNSSPFCLGKTKWYPFILKKTCTNGSSELMTNLSSSIVILQHLRREIHIHRVGVGGESQSFRLLGGFHRSRGLRFSVGLRLCGSFLLSRGFCRSRLRGVFLRRQILRPVQVAAAAELRQNILQGKLRYFVVILSVFHGTSLLDAPGPYTVRCRTASYSKMAAAADAFREDILPRMGMLTRKSQFSATKRLMPSPSEPMTMAAGPLRSAS